MKRAAAAAVVVLAVAFPRDAHLTIASTQTMWLPGMRVVTQDVIGCATTHDYPSDATAKAAEAAEKKRLADGIHLLERAYGQFLNGKHPWTRHRSWLAQTAAPWAGVQDEDDYAKAEANAKLPLAPAFLLGALQVSLVVKPGTPPAVLAKLPFEFLLAQTAEGGVLLDPKDRKALGVVALQRDEVPFSIRFLQASYPTELDRLLAGVVMDRRLLQPDPAPLPDDLELRRRALLARAGAAVLGVAIEGRSLDAALPSLLALDPPLRWPALQLLVLCSPLADGDRRALRRFGQTSLDALGRQVFEEQYGALLADPK